VRPLNRTSAVFVFCLAFGWEAILPAQTAPATQNARREPVPAAITAEPSGQAVTFAFFNRPIVVLRARVLGRGPVERAEGARRALDDLVARRITRPVEWRSVDGGALITVASRGVLALTSQDVDELSGETVEDAAAQAVERMQRALDEAVEARTPGMLLRSGAVAAVVAALALLALWGITRAHRIVGRKLVVIAEQTVARSGIGDVDALRASRLLDVEHWFVTAAAVALDLAVVYGTVGFVLRQFPYTRAWGESMRGFLVTTVENLGLGLANAIPGLFTVAIVVFVARVLARLIRSWFNAIERGQLTPRWIYPETAQPTRRLLILLLWAFAVVVAYPYLPGSQSDAFKGVTVFLGLMVTFGSSGLVNHIMSGFMITYSRALRVGDFVRIGDVEGTVTHLGVLSIKVRTVRQEEVTIPNAVVVSQTTTDYSRPGDSEGVFTPTSVTIGYDAPWRQVQSLLLLAAERTPGLRREPKPIVLQTALEDFYVKYTLFVCLERQESRPFTLHTLHTNIQDLFNEYGVQIMSPNYVIDPATPKLVAKKDWFAAPASGCGDRPRDGS
jgi:small-conductance mechanosensitive channel